MFDPLAAIHEAIDKASASEHRLDVVEVRRAIDRLEHVLTEQVRVAECSGAWQADGFLSVTAWLRAKCRMTHGAASAVVDLARRLERLPVTSEAFAAGRISRAHAQVITNAATTERVDALAEVEGPLVAAAEAASPRELRQLVQQVTDALDGDGGATAAWARHERRRLHVSPSLDGMVAIDGMLDAERGAIVIGALESAMDTARAAGDARGRPQQRADALVELCRVGARDHATGPGRRHRPHITMVLDVEALDPNADPTVRRRADDAHVGRLPIATVERLLCDCGLSRVVTNGDSIPIDVGRSTRVVSGALWRALVVRDGGCVVPGCDRPPGWCEAHHRVPWSQGGPTSLENCELRCFHHHQTVHEEMRAARGP
jgi:hypothetical protein